MNSYIKPDRPTSSVVAFLRLLVRRYRLMMQMLLLTAKGRRFLFGRNINIGRDMILNIPSEVRIGNNVWIGGWFYSEANLEIGNDVLISSKVSCVGNDHSFDNETKSITDSERFTPSKIRIEGDNLIGYGTIIVGNVSIGKGCVVGAGAVVTRDLPPYTVCAGVPAKVIRKRFEKKV